MPREKNLHGLLAEFQTPEALLSAAEQAYAAGYRSMDAFSPFPVEGLDEAIGLKRPSIVAWFTFAGGLAGAIGGFFMQYFATVIDYPLNIGGRPLNSWPAYIPITFELTVLSAAFAALIGMMVLNRLPEPYHPVFNVPGFERATRDRFFLAIESRDTDFNRITTKQFLQNLKPIRVMEIEA
jgi:hypothetical protein